MKHGQLLGGLPGTDLWAAMGRDETASRIRDLPPDAHFDPSADRIVMVDRDVVLLQVMYCGIYSMEDADALQAILRKYVDFDKFTS